jgi:hypothetical protein
MVVVEPLCRRPARESVKMTRTSLGCFHPRPGSGARHLTSHLVLVFAALLTLASGGRVHYGWRGRGRGLGRVRVPAGWHKRGRGHVHEGVCYALEISNF